MHKVSGFGAAIFDVHLLISDEELVKLGYEKGQISILNLEQRKAFFDFIGDREIKVYPGGAAANTTATLAKSGVNSNFFGCVGDDKFGHDYISSCKDEAINFVSSPINGEHTGLCFILVTPDGERTMLVSPEVSGKLNFDESDFKDYLDSDWIFLEGQLLSYNAISYKAFIEIINFFSTNNSKIAISLGDINICKNYRQEILKLLSCIDLIIGNRLEFFSLTEESENEKALRKLENGKTEFSLTLGSEGAISLYDGKFYSGNSQNVECVNATGAGDVYASAYIYSKLKSCATSKCIENACNLASKVVSQTSARLDSENIKPWLKEFR